MLALNEDEWEGPRNFADTELLNEMEETNKEDINHGNPDFVAKHLYENVVEA